MTIKDSIFINAPVEKVFATFRDLDKATESMSSITKIEVLEGPAILEMGTKWRETRKMFGQEATEEMYVTGFEMNHMYKVEAESSGAHYITVFSFTPQDSGTLVEMSFEGMAKSFMAKLFTPLGYLFANASKKALHQDLEDLKKVAEQP